MTSDSPAFPRHCDGVRVTANSASGYLNKWPQTRFPKGRVVHSFRQSFIDGLRVVKCPSDMIEALNSWSATGVGSSYRNIFQLG